MFQQLVHDLTQQNCHRNISMKVVIGLKCTTLVMNRNRAVMKYNEFARDKKCQLSLEKAQTIIANRKKITDNEGQCFLATLVLLQGGAQRK